MTMLCFAVRNMLLIMVQLGSSATEYLLSLQINTIDVPVNLLSVYAPTLMAPDDIKDNFYSQLDTIIKRISTAAGPGYTGQLQHMHR